MSSAISKAVVNDDDDDDKNKKPKALTDEELEKKRKREVALQAKQDAVDKMFGRKKKSKSNEKKDESMVSHLQLRIPLEPPVALTPMENRLKTDNKRFEKFYSMEKEGEILSLPEQDELKLVEDLKKEYKDLKSMDPEPEDYFTRAEQLFQRFDGIEKSIKEDLRLIGDAVSAYYIALARRKSCKDNNDFKGGAAWKQLEQTLVCLGVVDILKDMKQRVKDSEMKAAAAAVYAARQEQAAVSEAAAAAASATIDLTEETDSAVVSDSVGTEPTKAVIVNNNGEEVELESVLQGGKLSERARERKMKQRAVNSATKAKKSKSAMRKTVGQAFKNRAKFQSSLMKAWNYGKRGGLNKLNHGLEVQTDAQGILRLRCSLCQCAIADGKVSQHLSGDRHYSRFEKERDKDKSQPKELEPDLVEALRIEGETQPDAFERFKNEAISELRTKQANDNLAGSTLSDEVLKYKMNVLEHACYANMAMNQLERFKGALNLKGSPGLSIGSAYDLPRTVGEALRNVQRKSIRWIMSDCYRHFGTISDGSPLGANAEVIIVRMVRCSDLEIVDVVISVKLFESSMSGEGIAMLLLSELQNYGLDLNYWRASMMDRASNNGKALRTVHQVSCYRPMSFPCFSHTFNLPGKEFKEECKILHKFRKAFNTGIMFRGKMFHIVKDIYKVSPIVCGGVRWYLEWEQIAQMDAMGIARIARDVVAAAEEKEVSVESVKKMKEWSKDEYLPRLIVEAGAVTEVGRHFCLATYASEGDAPLPFTFYVQLDKLDAFVERLEIFDEDGHTWQRCKEAAKLVEPTWNDMTKDYDSAYTNVQNIRAQVSDLEEELNQFDLQEEQQEVSEQNLGRGNRTRRANPRFQDSESEDESDEGDDNLDARKEIENRLEAKNSDLTAAEKEADTLQMKLVQFQKKYGGLITEKDFMEHAKKCVEASIRKYKRLFENDTRLRDLRRAYRACKLFDVLYLQTNPSHDQLRRMIDELCHFGFKEFTPTFLAELKNEIPALLDLVQNMEYNFEGKDAEKNDKAYRKRVNDKFRRSRQRSILMNIENTLRQQENPNTEDTEDHEVGEVDAVIDIEALVQEAGEDDVGQDTYRKLHWKDDIGERARRVYDWWRTAMTERKDSSIPRFYEAVKLIAVTQVSSAAAERVFSQLFFIRRAVGDKTLQDMMELRTFIRCNNGFSDDFNDSSE